MLLRLLPGIHRDNLQRALLEVSTAAGNARGAGGDAVARYGAYVRWANDSVRALSLLVSADDLDRLIRTPAFWHLHSMHPTPDRDSVWRLLDNELDERARVLEAAHDAVRRLIERWSGPGVFVVADTSVFIEHPDKLEPLDLAALLSLRDDPVHLLVPAIVVDELDRLKQASRPRARWRARYTLAVLDRLFQAATGPVRLREADFSPLDSGGIPRGGVTVEIVLDEPGHTRLPIADDEVIDRALAIETLAGRPVRLLTFDTGQATRSRAARLNVVKLDDPPEGDEPSR